MPNVWVRNKKLDIDLVSELQDYEWTLPNWSEEKLIAASPFRYDQHPSFFVNLENLPDKEIAGSWKDSGSGESGNLLQLLSFLRNEDEDDTFEYLMEMYAPRAYSDKKSLGTLKTSTEFKPLECNLLHDVMYLQSRGISLETIYKHDIRIESDGSAVAFLWKNPRNEIQAIKYRSMKSKKFYYEKNGQRLNTLLYGIDQVYKQGCRTIAITEAEIDALSWWEYGRGAVALGGASISKRQVDILKQSGVENIIISTDNDKAGQKLAQKITEVLQPFFNVFTVKWKNNVKDVNDFILEFNRLPPIMRVSSLSNSLNFKN
ncbi:DNA primase [Bacillus pseudomycoides]|uniref:toprim domain-containing protein n=1 Tax=Bacillus pseudomycoides TaxID=64104 RepID=UPI000BFCFEC3|nr:toprim domain-containing protein [Bacillus pseudomycoides]PHB23089.1 DNA primase [Bacillus pseudomycoides]PHE37618.1 DNA primase [Bacillus pseudomycoides]